MNFAKLLRTPVFRTPPVATPSFTIVINAFYQPVLRMLTRNNTAATKYCQVLLSTQWQIKTFHEICFRFQYLQISVFFGFINRDITFIYSCGN